MIVSSCSSHTLYNIQDILNRCPNGVPYPLTFASYQSIISCPELSIPPKPSPAVDVDLMEGISSPIAHDHDDLFGVPTLQDLGFEHEGSGHCTKWPGGESEALVRLDRHLHHKAWVATFGVPKLTPNSLMNKSQNGLSPYLRFGCLSSRLFYHRLSELYQKMKNSQAPASLFGQLLWRDYFYTISTNNPNFDKMKDNPICLEIKWRESPEALAKWAEGRTGFPLIDAIQTQLRAEGWIHQIARHATISFLTRGILWISWEEGMKVFDELLLDADWSVNAGTWLWMSYSSFFEAINHVYDPVSFGRKLDPNGDYIRKYIPVLRNIPNQFIHEPWKAPLPVQQRANCIIGQHYPVPMVDHVLAAKDNREKMISILTFVSNFGLKDDPHQSSNRIIRSLTKVTSLPT